MSSNNRGVDIRSTQIPMTVALALKRNQTRQLPLRWITAEITLITDLRRLIYQNWSWINTSDINMSEETGKRTLWTKLHHEDARMNP
ncbi:hypothetical protein T4D_1845 [Trichinella pseudospiralis]|uniref:Uncharacterized protein n=1 Tax=Trichinella pseudospiralis TaxID=6337 RepID=A0A0V1G4U4_TRIPS|nr:hypothetical protein T4D_1845 [Trichinella pseudospiralis]